MKVPIICPITKTRMRYPVRADICADRHFECFDLLTYLEVSSTNGDSGSRWKCPVCNIPLTLLNLFKCDLTANLITYINNLYPIETDE